MTRALAVLSLIASVLAASTLAASERYEGYYYPQITSEETFERAIRTPPDPGRSVRVDFVTTLTLAQLEAPESPRFVFFAKGTDADRLILVALDDEVFSTLYRARAVMAQMTSNVRGGGFFTQDNLQYVATFYDMLHLLGFRSLVISDGDSWSHRVTFTQN
ncbi:MAG: hypothetical protein AB3N23_02630 [Paracoccaceae bacterium]